MGARCAAPLRPISAERRVRAGRSGQWEAGARRAGRGGGGARGWPGVRARAVTQLRPREAAAAAARARAGPAAPSGAPGTRGLLRRLLERLLCPAPAVSTASCPPSSPLPGTAWLRRRRQAFCAGRPGAPGEGGAGGPRHGGRAGGEGGRPLMSGISRRGTSSSCPGAVRSAFPLSRIFRPFW